MSAYKGKRVNKFPKKESNTKFTLDFGELKKVVKDSNPQVKPKYKTNNFFAEPTNISRLSH